MVVLLSKICGRLSSSCGGHDSSLQHKCFSLALSTSEEMQTLMVDTPINHTSLITRKTVPLALSTSEEMQTLMVDTPIIHTSLITTKTARLKIL